jgi:hypothetical protein
VYGAPFVNPPLFDFIVHEGAAQSVALLFAVMPTSLS